MKKLLFVLITLFFSLNKVNCQEKVKNCKIIFDISYTIDTLKLKKSYEESMRDMVKQFTYSDSVNSKQKREEWMAETMSVFYETLSIMTSKRKVIVIKKDSIFERKEINLYEDEKTYTIKYSSNTDKALPDLLENIYVNNSLKKDINGYMCYVVDTSSEKDETKDKYKMFVTDDLIFPYHPVLKFDKSLSKFYPMEVTVERYYIKGLETTYTVKSVELL